MLIFGRALILIAKHKPLLFVDPETQFKGQQCCQGASVVSRHPMLPRVVVVHFVPDRNRKERVW